MLPRQSTMITEKDPFEVRRRCDEARGRGERVALVPTMGYLHAGHLALVERARAQADQVVVSIFVNPTQFGEGEDLERYPRDPEGDAKRCAETGVDLLFCPEVEAIYPPGFQTYVEVEQVSQGLCGGRRPGHFRGVCTMVTKLFQIVGPCLAVFGEKDYQQLQVIRTMVRDLAMPIAIEGVPTIREPDGLAMSSRNASLDPDERQAATCLSRALAEVAEQVKKRGALPAADALALARKTLHAAPGARIDYVELRDAETLEPVEIARHGQAVMLLAVDFSKARLIDNRRL